MIKLKDLLTETIACGECLQYAWKTYIVNQDNKSANRISKWAMKGWPKREFYSFWNPKNMKKYTPKEASDNFKRTKSMIGWDW